MGDEKIERAAALAAFFRSAPNAVDIIDEFKSFVQDRSGRRHDVLSWLTQADALLDKAENEIHMTEAWRQGYRGAVVLSRIMLNVMRVELCLYTDFHTHYMDDLRESLLTAKIKDATHRADVAVLLSLLDGKHYD